MSSTDKLGENMNEEHLLKELGILKNRFPKLDEEYISSVLKEKKGHAGLTTQSIFKAGGEGVSEAEDIFYKGYPGAFNGRILMTDNTDGLDGMIYLWNINYDGSFVRDRKSKIFHDKDGKEVELFRCDCFMCEEGDPKHKNQDYFDRLALEGNSAHGDGKWGSHPYDTYDENHPLNEKGVIMTIYELEVILHIWKVPLLGVHPYTDENGERCNYIGKEVRNRIKEKLPMDWTRKSCEEYNGLWCYNNHKKNIVQWGHPKE